MKTLFYLHYNEQEISERIKPLKAAGYKVIFHSDKGETAKFGEQLPDIFVLSIDRLPSHAKAYAQWIWQAKKRQHLPIVFVGGTEEKTGNLKALFPKAVFCENKNLVQELKKLK